MMPFVEYIPLNYNVSNLEETLIWIKENPTKVKEIVATGRLFHERYLSFEKMEEFLYELVYRLAEDRTYMGIYDSNLTNPNAASKSMSKSQVDFSYCGPNRNAIPFSR